MSSLVIADLNGDGKPDLAVSNSVAVVGGKVTGGVSVLLGNGDGTFAKASLPFGTGGLVADSIAAADVSGDGIPDLAVTNNNQNRETEQGSVGVLLGNGDGTFKQFKLKKECLLANIRPLERML